MSPVSPLYTSASLYSFGLDTQLAKTDLWPSSAMPFEGAVENVGSRRLFGN